MNVKHWCSASGKWGDPGFAPEPSVPSAQAAIENREAPRLVGSDAVVRKTEPLTTENYE